MICILEGENKTGKSTLAHYIEEHHGFRYIKVSQPGPEGPYKEYTVILSSIKKGENVVIDRFHIGEEVYGPIYRGKSCLTSEQFQEIEKKINDLNGILIYCYDTEDNIAKRFDEEGEEFADKDKIKKTLELYASAIKKSNLIKYKHKINGRMDLIKTNQIEKIIKKYIFIEN